MSTKALISIIVPCYNQAEYLPETLQSVLDQSYQNWECIIVNDGSPDNTEEVAIQWQRKDRRFKYFKKENGGVSEARNYGINKSEGTYILPLDGDDLISKDYVSEAIHTLESDNRVKLVYARAQTFGLEEKEWILLPYSYYNLLFVRNCIFSPAIYRRSDYLKTRGYDKNLHVWEDYDFWLSLLKKEDIVYKIDKIHLFYRIKEVSKTTQVNEDLEHKLRMQIFKNHEDVYLQYINPIEVYNEAQRNRGIVNSLDYRIGRAILAPFRFMVGLVKKGK